MIRSFHRTDILNLWIQNALHPTHRSRRDCRGPAPPFFIKIPEETNLSIPYPSPQNLEHGMDYCLCRFPQIFRPSPLCRAIPSRCCSCPFPPSQNSEPSVLVCEKEVLPLHPPEVRSSLHTNTLVDYPISARYTASVWSRSWNLEPCIVRCVRELEVSPTALHPDQEFDILVPTNRRPIPHGSRKMSGKNSVAPCWLSRYAPPSDPKGPSL